MWVKLSFKKSLLVIQPILGLLINTLTTDDKYSLLNRDNLAPQIQMQISENEKQVSNIFSEFLKSRWNFEHF